MKEVELCLRTLGPALQKGGTVERELISDFLYIVGAGSHWAVHPDGMIQRNQLMEENDTLRLRRWLAELSMALAMIVEAGCGIEDAMAMLESEHYQ